MKKAKNILLWVLTVFMLLSALVYMPSAASVFMLLFAAIAVPVPQVSEFWSSKRVKGVLKAAVLCALFIVSVSLAPIDRTESNTDKGPAPAPESSDDFIQEVESAIDGQIGQGEKITSIEKDGDNLIIKVDMSGATDTHGIPLSLIAEGRCSSITDAILELEKDDQWETITIDFGDLGSMTCGKGDIEENEYGRYISSAAITNSSK